MATKPEHVFGATKPECSDVSDGQVDGTVPCAPCLSEGQTRSAEKFCQDCGHALCLACVKHHGKFPALRNHQIVKLSAANITSASGVWTPLEHCADHGGKLVDMYCAGHDMVCCSTCVNVKHRTCERVSYIPEVAKGFVKNVEFRSVLADIQTSLAELEKVETSAKEDLTRVEKRKNAALDAVTKLSTRIRRQVEKLEKQTREEISCKFDRESQTIREIVERSRDGVKEIARADERLRNKGKEPDVFVTVKLVKQRMRDSDELKQRAAVKIGEETIIFKPNEQLEAVLNNLSSLGACVYRGKAIGQHSIRTSGDQSSCHISGIANLPDGRTVVTDWDNKAVKLLDKEYKVVSRLNVFAGPESVCCMSNDELAITLLHRQRLQVLKVTDKLANVRVINVDENCHCVAYFNGILYITCFASNNHSSAKVLVCAASGKKLSEFNKNPSGEKIFSSPSSIIVTENGAKICVTDFDKGIIVLDIEGRVLSVLPATNLQSPYGICSDPTGQVLLCCRDAHTVLQLGSGNVVVGTVLQKSDGLNKPTEIYYDAENSRLLVSMWESDVFHVFDMTV